MKRIVKTYLYSDKEVMYEQFAEELEIPDEDYDNPILDKLKRALYEVEFTLEVDTETGDYEILKVEET